MNWEMNQEMNRDMSSISRETAWKVGLRKPAAIGGLFGLLAGLACPIRKLLGRMRGTKYAAPKLALVERIALAPRHSLALVEAEGRRLLVAISSDGNPAFFALDESSGARVHSVSRGSSRVSW
jgi:Flagellar biosynthesis protein, FliO